jgi:hypothetical protein
VDCPRSSADQSEGLLIPRPQVRILPGALRNGSIFPVVTGTTGNARLFDGYPDLKLELVENRVFDGGLQLLEYVPTVLDGPPGA